MTTETINLAQLAHMKKKPTKAAAQQLLRELVEAHSEAILNGHGRHYDAVISLYAYFMPPPPKTAKTNFEWVAKATATKDLRAYLNAVQVTETRIYATDGARLHIAPNTDNLKPGAYATNGDYLESLDAQTRSVGKYPEIDRVIPKATQDATQLTRGSLTLTEQGKLMVYTLDPATFGFTAVLQKSYVDDALNGLDSAVATMAGPREPLRLDMPGGRLAVVMPVRL